MLLGCRYDRQLRVNSFSVMTALAVGLVLETWGKPEIDFREEAHPELDAVRKWAEIRTDQPEDELTGVVFACDAVAVDEGGRWTMPFQWPRLSHRRSDFTDDKRYDGGWGEDPCPLVVDRGTRFYFEIEDAAGTVTRDYRTGSGSFSRVWQCR